MYISDNNRIAPESLYKVICRLHDILLSLADFNETIQNDISLLCELWFKQERDGRENICPQMISYLLALALSNFNSKDSARLMSCQEALSYLDLDDPSSDSLRILIQRCFLHSYFLTKERGKKFLVSLFSLSPNLIKYLHRTIKSALIACSKYHAEVYSDIYFKSWKSSNGLYRMNIENLCIQNFIHISIHAKNNILLRNSKIIMKRFTDEKVSNRDVEEMLERLYSPILWKSLEVANPEVRENALFQFSLVFPLIKSDTTNVEFDESLHEQIRLLVESLSDKYPNVRKQGILASGRILSIYWELLNHQVVTTILNQLYNNLAFDKSSPQVREAVLKATIAILENPISHSTLSKILPQLSPLIHDVNEKVRQNMILLLEKLSKSVTIQFYKVVPVDQLLQSLSLETNKKNKINLTNLLMPTYWPIEKHDAKEIAKRTVVLVTENPTAATVFFQNLNLGNTSVIDVVIIMRRIWNTTVKPWTHHSVKETEEENYDESNPKRSKTNESIIKEYSNEVIISFLHIISLLWEKIDDKLAEKKDKDLIKKLIDTFSDETLTELVDKIDHFTVYQIASHIPYNLIPTFVKKTMKSLETTKYRSHCLECLFSWNQNYNANVMKNIAIGLELPFKEDDLEKDDIEIVNQSIKNALSLISSLMSGAEWLRSEFLETEGLQTVLDTMFKYHDVAEYIISQKGKKDDHIYSQLDHDVVIECIALYYRIIIHLKALKKEQKEDLDIEQQINYLLEWAESKVLSELKSDDDDDILPSTVEDSMARLHQKFPLCIMKPILIILSDCYVIGYASNAFASRIIELCGSLFKSIMNKELNDASISTTWRIILNYYLRYQTTDIFEEEQYLLKDSEKVLETIRNSIKKDADSQYKLSKNGLNFLNKQSHIYSNPINPQIYNEFMQLINGQS